MSGPGIAPTIPALADYLVRGADMAEATPKKRRRTTPPEIRFMRKVAIDATTGCWLWLGVTSNGYGQFRDGRTVRAHRWSYQHFVGPVSIDLDLDHLCRVRSCVNPQHLEPVTRQVNLRRSPLTSTARSDCPKGHPLDGWDRKRNSRYCKTCNRISNRRWKERRKVAVAVLENLGGVA